VVLSVLLAFFPKCALCWAAYMSMFGCVVVARAPYVSWLFPVLVGLAGVHLALLLRKSRNKGYGPFLSSLAGVALLLTGRTFFPEERWVLFLGLLLLAASSLAASFGSDVIARKRLQPKHAQPDPRPS
jgi:hypothetical protein